MNLRKISLKYFGWCPGFESASKFIPERATSPSRLFLVISIISFTIFLSFHMTQQGLMYFDFPRDSVAITRNNNPKLVIYDNHLFFSTVVETLDRNQAGDVTFKEQSIYLAELSLKGTIDNEVKIVERTGYDDIEYDILYTEAGEWILAYDNNVIISGNGKEFSDPVSVGSIRFDYYPGINLLEHGKEVLLLYSEGFNGVFYSYNIESGWTKRHEGPLEALMQVPFVDTLSRLSIIGVDYDPNSRKAVMVDGIYYSANENNTWTKPKYLINQGVTICGYHPQIYYSDSREGYFLILKDPDPSSFIEVFFIYFTPDFENWSTPVPFQLGESGDGIGFECRDMNIIELSNGTFIMAFRGDYFNLNEMPESFSRISTSLYLSSSEDGVNWTPPFEIEMIVDEEALIRADASFRSVPSVIISIGFAIVSIFLISKKQLLYV
jgi:hypothetical protein